MTKRIFYLLLRQIQKQDKKLEVQFFLVHLLMPLTGWPYFCLVLETSVLGLTVYLAISRVELIGGEVAVGLSR